MIVGDNWENISNFKLVTKELKNFRYVIYDKDVQYEDYPKFYQQMRIYLSVSEYEGGPIPALEALACGVPVVLSDTGFARNLVVSGNNGYVFPVNDLDLAEYFLRLAYAGKFDDPRQSIINYTWENYARKIWQGLVRL